MKTRATVQVTIHADTKTVFKYLSDLRYGPLWMPNLVSLSPKKVIKQGDTYKIKSLVFGVVVEGINKVLVLAPDKRLVVVNEMGALQYRVDHRLSARGTKTLLATTVDVQTVGRSFAFAKSVIGPMAKRYMRSELSMLKTAVEEGLKP